jgi:hypothetical protein
VVAVVAVSYESTFYWCILLITFAGRYGGGGVVAVVVVAAAVAADTAIRTMDMVVVTMVMATRAAVVTDGNGTDDPLTSLLPLLGTSEHCSFWT